MYYLNMWFRENLGLKVVSVLIAACLWAYVMVRENPVVELSLPRARVVMAGVPPGLTVVEFSPEAGEVKITGLRRLVQGLSNAPVLLTVDLSGQAAGTHLVPVSAPTLPQGVTLESFTPATVRVTLDKTVTETHSISVRLRGEPAPGYVFGPPSPTPAEARVTGAASLMARLSGLVAAPDASGLAAATELTRVPVVAVDDQGNALPGLRLDPAEVTVAVAVTRGAATSKTVPVRPQLGKPAPGYQVTNVTAHPDEITVTGGSDALAHLEAAPTESIPIEQVTSTATYKVKVILPEGVKREEEGLIEVTVTVAKRSEVAPAETPPGPASPGPGAASAPPSGPAAPPPPAPPAGPAPPEEGKPPSSRALPGR
jgi:YbbR domain-containing protein